MAETNRPNVKFHNVSTGEIIEREMNDAEFSEFEAEAAARQVAQAEAETKAAAREAILERLGITADEAALLLG